MIAPTSKLIGTAIESAIAIARVCERRGDGPMEVSQSGTTGIKVDGSLPRLIPPLPDSCDDSWADVRRESRS